MNSHCAQIYDSNTHVLLYESAMRELSGSLQIFILLAQKQNLNY